MTATSHKPARTCVACRTTAEKGKLLRIVRRSDGTVALDLTGRVPGRGAYVCADEKCIGKALKSKLLQRALRTSIDATQLWEPFRELNDLSVKEGKVQNG
jgi:predicted RNA-binding protein YlxR (DUF448 family)